MNMAQAMTDTNIGAYVSVFIPVSVSSTAFTENPVF